MQACRSRAIREDRRIGDQPARPSLGKFVQPQVRNRRGRWTRVRRSAEEPFESGGISALLASVPATFATTDRHGPYFKALAFSAPVLIPRQPRRFSVSSRVDLATPKLRHTEALLAPPSKAEVI